MRPWIALLGLALATASAAQAAPSADEARRLAEEAYVFAYATAEHNKVLNAIAAKLPYNRLISEPRLLGPEDTRVVSPNNDTFYSRALLDLRGEPMVLHVPEVRERYYSFQLVDLRTDNLDYVGTRSTGGGAGRYLIAGPDWQGELPAGFDGLIRSPSRLVFLLGRTEVRGEADLTAAAAVVKGYGLQPLSSALAQPAPTALAPLALPPYQDTKQGKAVSLFDSFGELLPLHRWTPGEQARLARFAEIGVRAGLPFSPPPALAGAISAGAEAGRDKVRRASTAITREQNGWFDSPLEVGQFGEDDLSRAAVAWRYIYANDAAEAIYPLAMHDGRGQPLRGDTAYRLRFAPGQLPPVRAFWSLTLYDGKTQLLSANPLKRYSLGDRSSGLKYDADGGLTLLIQHQAPTEAEQGNWLPAPIGEFNVMLRLYMPQPVALAGGYQLPAIQPVKE
jgi:hypothetical protein